MTNQINNSVARAIVRRVSDTGGRQSAQVEVTKGELISDVPRMQNYGFTGVPAAGGCDAVVVFLGGDRGQGIIIAMENKQFRLESLESGEVAMYDDLGNFIKLGREKLEVEAVTEVSVAAPIVNVKADTVNIEATQVNIEATRTDIGGQLFNNGVNVGSTHQHANGTLPTGTTSVPQ